MRGENAIWLRVDKAFVKLAERNVLIKDYHKHITTFKH